MAKNSSEKKLSDDNNRSGLSTSSEAALPAKLTFYLVRHGKTILNMLERVQGWSDAVLTPEGEEVVIAAGVGLRNIDFQGVYSSDSGRAVQTAKMILTQNKVSAGREVVTDSRLREYSFGSYEGEYSRVMQEEVAESLGLSWAEFLEVRTARSTIEAVAQLDKARSAPDVHRWSAEDYEPYKNRLLSGIESITQKELKTPGSGNILVVSHGVSIDTVLSAFSEQDRMMTTGLQNASVSTVEYQDEHYRVTMVNDTSHISLETTAS